MHLFRLCPSPAGSIGSRLAIAEPLLLFVAFFNMLVGGVGVDVLAFLPRWF